MPTILQHYFANNWVNQIQLGEMAIFTWLSFYIYKKTHVIPATTFLYFGIYSIYSQYNSNAFYSPDIDVTASFAINTGRSLVFLILAVLPFIFSTKKDLLIWGRSFGIFALLNSVFMIFNYFKVGAATGFIGMDSVDGTFLAIVLPLFLFGSKETRMASVILITAMLLSRSSTVFGALCLQILTYTFLRMRKNYANLVLLFASALAVIPLGHFYLGRNLLDSNGRMNILMKSYEFFHSLGDPIFGLGTGSFLVLMPLVQGTNHPYFVWLHNEPFQILFEQGLVGLFLLIGLFTTMVLKNRKNTPFLLVLLTVGFQSFLQPSFRYFIFALFLVFLTRLAFDNNQEILINRKGFV